ncbi:MAG: HAD family hydrolase [Candidatus Methanofastidiosia archaeon]|jgi:HAD superfamily hydrolase (TIGR01549 family)
MAEKKEGLVIFDLDNTLVDKNAVFEKAQSQMIHTVKGKKTTAEDIKILRKMDSSFIKKFKSHLYPFEILALSLWFYYHKNLNIKESIRESVKVFNGSRRKVGEIKKAVQLAKKAASIHDSTIMNDPAELFDGVKEVLEILKKRGYKIVLLSEGSEELQKKTLEVHNLKQYFDDIVLCSRKNKECFSDIKNRWYEDDGKSNFFVVGDRIERDIEPGKEVGAKTVWKPGNFNPGTPSSDMNRPDHSIIDIRSLLNVLP